MVKAWGTHTGGIGTSTTAHLNLTRSLADTTHFANRAKLTELRKAAHRPSIHFPTLPSKNGRGTNQSV